MEDQGNVKRLPDRDGLVPVTLPYNPKKASKAKTMPNEARRRGQQKAAKELGKPSSEKPAGY
jgi:hypothetical protein